MAENKKSVILYIDLIHVFEGLEDDEAGRLIKHYLRYVNDLNPEAPDKLTKLLFEPIKQQLKRDLVKWEKTQGEKSDSGQLGNLKRWHPDIYKMVSSNKITIEQGIKIANDRKASHSDKVRQDLSQTVANIAVNVIVDDNVNASRLEEETATTPDSKYLKVASSIADWSNTQIQYCDATDEFKAMYSQELFDSWRRFNVWLNENCPYLRGWENQIKIHEYKIIREGMTAKKHTLKQVHAALKDLNDHKPAKDKYTSVYGGFTRFLKTVVENEK